MSSTTAPFVVATSAGNAQPIFGAPRTRWIDVALPDPADQRAYAEERAIVVFTELVAELMEEAGVTRAELADRLGVHKSQVTRLLSKGNMNLRTFARVLWALGKEPEALRVIDFGTTSADAEPLAYARASTAASGALRVAEPSPGFAKAL